MSKRLVVLRSCPGGGKSFLARQLRDEAISNGQSVVIASADDYHMVSEGGEMVYRFNPNNLAEAHRQCRRKAEQAMRDGVNLVLIDNTNTTRKEVYPYVEVAVCLDYEVEFLEPTTPWWLSVKPLLVGNKKEKLIRPHCKVFVEKNSHGVPEQSIFKMLMRWEADLTVEKVLNTSDSS